MGWTFSDFGSDSDFITGSMSASAVAVSEGDLIVVFANCANTTSIPNSVTDTELNNYTLRTALENGQNCFLAAYMIAAGANASNVVTVGYATADSTAKQVLVLVFTPTAGEVTLDDVGWIFEGSGYEASPWETNSNNNTGTDTIAIVGFGQDGTRIYSSPEIPSGTAADGSEEAGRTIAFYRELTTTGSIEAEVNVDGSQYYCAEMLCFNIASAAKSINPEDVASQSVVSSSSLVAIPVGSICWGHVTGVTQDNTRTFATNWTGTGTIVGSGDSEVVKLASTEYVESETISLGAGLAEITLGTYQSGQGTPVIKYKDGDSVADCEADTWNTYSTPYTSQGYVKVRLER